MALPIRLTLRSRPVTGDLVAGVSVALVLIPQSVAYAVLAGVPPERGLAAGIVATLVAGPLLSSPFLQSGPTAITSLLTLGTLSTLATPGGANYIGLAALLAIMIGLLRVAIGLARAGEIAFFLSVPVLTGFTAAAAMVIIASQLSALTGLEVERGSVLLVAVEVLGRIGEWRWAEVLLGVGAIAVVQVCRRLSPLVPGVLLALVAGLVAGQVLGEVATLGSLPSAVPALSLDLPWAQVGTLVVPALIIAVIGFSEAAAIAQSLSATAGQPWDPDQEFGSQGASNVVAGLLGGFPVGASFSRSALNQLAGARTAWSGIATGLVCLAALPLTGLLADLPDAVIAGVIVAAVVGLADPRPVTVLRRQSRQQWVIAVVTAGLTIVLAPQVHWAILTGIVLSIGAHLRRERMISTEHWTEGETLHVRPAGVLWFGSARRFEDQMMALLAERRWDAMVVHLQRLGRTDVSGAYALQRLVVLARERGTTVTLSEPTDGSRRIVDRVVGLDQPATDDGASDDGDLSEGQAGAGA